MPRLHKTLTDYLVIAISPALIMTLIGSLAFFLLAVFYRGQHGLRLNYVIALFVFAAVLIARISIEESRERAMLFAVPLTLATLLVGAKFVSFSGPLASYSLVINAGLLLLILWCADRLTWDCTVIDDQEDASGEGLLQTAGLDRPAGAGDSAAPAAPPEPAGTTQRKLPATGWWERFLERRRRRHAPGVWVVYFSLAALPIFGMGQRLIPATDLATRRDVFWLLCLYVASGLGLLVTTSFLGLRRYLRQRHVEMPLEMAGVWLSLGAIMIVVLLMVCALLPRPSAEYSITHLSFQVGSPDNLQPSRHALGTDGKETRDQPASVTGGSKPTDKPTDKPADPSAKSADKSSGAPGDKSSGQASGEPGDKSSGGAADKSSSDKSSGDKSSGSPGDKSSGKPADKSPGEKSPGDKSSGSPADKSSGKPQAADAGKSEKPASPGSAPDKSARSWDGAKQPQSDGATKPDAAGEKSPSQRRDGKPRPDSSSAQEAKDNRSSAPPKSPPPSSSSSPSTPPSSFSPMRLLNQMLGSAPYLLKAIYYLAFAALVGYLVWRYRRAVWAALRDFLEALRSFWEHLFGVRHETSETPASAAEPARPLPRFADFPDPFASGAARRMKPDELIVYSFQALEAWAREQGCGRLPDQTPHELAEQIAAAHPAPGAEAAGLANQYCCVAYAPALAVRPDLAQLQRLWRVLQEAQRAPEPVAASSSSR